jgi:integrase
VDSWGNISNLYQSYLLERSLSDNTVRNRTKALDLYLIRKGLPYPFSLTEIKSLVLGYRSKRSKCFTNYLITCINSFLEFCQTFKSPQEDFRSELNRLRPRVDRAPDPSKIISMENLERILSSPPRRVFKRGNLNRGTDPKTLSKVDKVYDMIFLLICETGCRSGEAVKLKKEDVNFDLHNVFFRETKTHKNRAVALSPRLEEKLKPYVKNCQTEYLFTSHTLHKDTPISQEMVNRMFKARCRALGIMKATIHWMRHSYITWAQVNGMSTPVCQAIVGHKKLETTSLYTHINTELQRQAMIRFNPSSVIYHNALTLFKKVTDILETLKVDPKKFSYGFEEGTQEFVIRIKE